MIAELGPERMVAGKFVASIKWTDALVAELRRLWNVEKLSAGVIAERLGISRNAVIGKAHRIKCEPRAHPIREPRQERTPEEREAMRQARQARWKASRRANTTGRQHKSFHLGVAADHHKLAVARQATARSAAPSRFVPYRTLERLPAVVTITSKKCQWIEGEPMFDDSCKCLRPSVSGAYCADHAAMAWRPRPAKQTEPKTGANGG